jgi:hypothetical protein
MKSDNSIQFKYKHKAVSMPTDRLLPIGKCCRDCTNWENKNCSDSKVETSIVCRFDTIRFIDKNPNKENMIIIDKILEQQPEPEKFFNLLHKDDIVGSCVKIGKKTYQVIDEKPEPGDFVVSKYTKEIDICIATYSDNTAVIQFGEYSSSKGMRAVFSLEHYYKLKLK